MAGFGDKLKREREMRGVTLEEIADSTKISRRHLRSLELEQFHDLPGGIFNKGFVRAYARYLGIDEDQAIADYVDASHELPPSEDEFPLEIPDEKEKTKLNPKLSFLPLLVALAALVLVLVAWAYWNKHKADSENAGASRTTTSAEGSTRDAVRENRTAQPAQSEKTERKRAAESSSSSLLQDVAEDTEKPLKVVVQATADSWISLNADGRTVMEGILTAGSQRSFTAGRQIVLKTGNAQGLEVSYNGTPVTDLAVNKKVRTLVFTPLGLEQ